MHKKAQGMSINVVIVAAIALLVLVVLAAIFISRLSVTKTAIETCESYGGKCFDGAEGCQDPYTIQSGAYKCLDLAKKEKEGFVCCLKV